MIDEHMTDEALRQIQKRAQTDLDFRQLLIEQPDEALQGYDLTEAQRHTLILPNFSWLIEKQVAGVGLPRTAEAFALLREKGVTALITLTEKALPTSLTEQYQFKPTHLPIADFTSPTLAQVEEAVATIKACVAQGQAVAVHCAAGLGRTGTILACYLVSQGSTSDEAMAEVRSKRPGSIETEAQAEVVRQYSENLTKEK